MRNNKPQVVERIIERPIEPQMVSAQEYLHTHTAGATVPLFQAVITGALFALFLLVLLLWQRVRDGGIYALLVFCFVTAVTWIMLQGHWFSLTKLEKLTGRDINGDGMVGDSNQVTTNHTVKVDLRKITQDGYTHVERLTLPVTESELATLAAGLLAGRSLTEREWAGPGKLFSINQFREIRGELLKRGVVRPSNPKDLRQGFTVTRAGMALMHHFAAMSENPYSPTTEVIDGEIA